MDCFKISSKLPSPGTAPSVHCRPPPAPEAQRQWRQWLPPYSCRSREVPGSPRSFPESSRYIFPSGSLRPFLYFWRGCNIPAPPSILKAPPPEQPPDPKSWGSAQKPEKVRFYPASTRVCWSMISEIQIRYGSRFSLHGRSLFSLLYQESRGPEASKSRSFQDSSRLLWREDLEGLVRRRPKHSRTLPGLRPLPRSPL